MVKRKMELQAKRMETAALEEAAMEVVVLGVTAAEEETTIGVEAHGASGILERRRRARKSRKKKRRRKRMRQTNWVPLPKLPMMTLYLGPMKRTPTMTGVHLLLPRPRKIRRKRKTKTRYVDPAPRHPLSLIFEG